MANVQFIWDLEEDADGNVQHIAEHGVTAEEAEEVVRHRYEDAVASRRSGRPTVFGWSSAGKYLAVAFEIVDEGLAQRVRRHRVRGAPTGPSQATEEEAMNERQPHESRMDPGTTSPAPGDPGGVRGLAPGAGGTDRERRGGPAPAWT